MAKGFNWVVIILVGILVGAALLLPPALAALGKSWSQFWKDLWAPFSDNGTDDIDDTNQTETSDFVGGSGDIGIDVNYKDGAVWTYRPQWAGLKYPFSILPLTIYSGEEGKEVASVTIRVYIQVETVGTVTSWTAAGPITAKLTGPTNRYSYDSTQISVSKTGLVSKASYEIWSRTYQASDIDSFIKSHINYPSPPYSCKLTWQVTDLSASFTFDDGYKEDSTGHNAYLDWSFTYYADSTTQAMRISSVSITVQAAALPS